MDRDVKYKMNLIEKLGEVKVYALGFKQFYTLLKDDPQALRQILEAVTEEMPELTKRYLDVPHTSLEYARTISFHSAWLAQELRAYAVKLEVK